MFVLSLIMIVGMSFAWVLLMSQGQGDLLDGDPTMSFVEYTNADINEVLRTLFRHINANYAVESGVEGTVNLRAIGKPFSYVLKGTLDQVHASSNYDGGIFMVEKFPSHPISDDVLARKLPSYDFRNVTMTEALDAVFEDAKATYRLSNINTKRITVTLVPGTLKQDLSVLLQFARCKANYTHGRFEFLPLSQEMPLKEVLEKHVHGIDFVGVEAKDAFSTFFRQIGAEYVLGPNIENRFTLHLYDAKFENALDILCQLTDTTYQLRGSVYKIERRSFQ